MISVPYARGFAVLIGTLLLILAACVSVSALQHTLAHAVAASPSFGPVRGASPRAESQGGLDSAGSP